MLDEKPDEIAIFAAAAALPEADQAAYLAVACDGHWDLQERIVGYLSAEKQPGPLDFEVPNLASSSLEAKIVIHQSADLIGTMIGPYKLLEQIGEGGMGVVYMAEQTEPVRRKVALKIIKPGMDTEAGHRPLRGRAAGPGADGPPQHRPGVRRRHHRQPAGPTS